MKPPSIEIPSIAAPPEWLGFLDSGPVLVLNHPEAIKHVLHDNAGNYIKGPLYDDLRQLFGDGLLTIDGGPAWSDQRRRVQPAFHASAMDAYQPVMIETIASFIDEWKRRMTPGRATDIFPAMTRLTLRVLSKAVFGLHLGKREDSILGALAEFLTFDSRTRGPIMGRVHKFVPFWARLHALKAQRAIEDSVTWIIENRSGPRDVIAYFAKAASDTATLSANQQVRDEVATLILAGHETSAIALVWAIYALTQHPEVEQRLRTEIDTVLGGRVPTPSDSSRLNYTNLVVKETLRVFPPVPTIARQAIGDDEIAGYRVPAGTRIRIKPAVLHRHPDFWENPDQFLPERFSAEQAAARSPYVYLPFGGGPRSCLGNQFAMIELRLALAMILQAVRLTAVPGRAPAEVVSNITLRPRFGVWMVPEFSVGDR